MEVINLDKYGHTSSPFERKLVEREDGSYNVIGINRVIGDREKPIAVDFDGGPFIGVGAIIGERSIKELRLEEGHYIATLG